MSQTAVVYIFAGCATVLTSHGSRSQSQASAFDENTLNESQLVQLTETFLSNDPDYEGLFVRLLQFVKEGYVETEEERMDRLVKVCLPVSHWLFVFLSLIGCL